jgi:hypothetical protein
MASQLRRPDYKVATHEACHAVAAYIVGVPVEKIEITDVQGLTKTGGKPSERSFDHAIVSLAPHEFLTSLGITAPGCDGDLFRAAHLCRAEIELAGGSSAAAAEAFAVVSEATKSLVAGDRFGLLVARLAPILAKRFWHHGPEVLRFLAANDPERETHERHSAESRSGPWYVVHDRTSGRVLYDGISYADAHAIQMRTGAHALLVGSSI